MQVLWMGCRQTQQCCPAAAAALPLQTADCLLERSAATQAACGASYVTLGRFLLLEVVLVEGQVLAAVVAVGTAVMVLLAALQRCLLHPAAAAVVVPAVAAGQVAAASDTRQPRAPATFLQPVCLHTNEAERAGCVS